MSVLTLWILEVFFGFFAIYTTLQFYVYKKSLNWFHTIIWFTSVIIVAFVSGELFT